MTNILHYELIVFNVFRFVYMAAYSRGGILQSSVASAYIMFLTGSALLIQPSLKCKLDSQIRPK